MKNPGWRIARPRSGTAAGDEQGQSPGWIPCENEKHKDEQD
jgi:hypothetical protein